MPEAQHLRLVPLCDQSFSDLDALMQPLIVGGVEELNFVSPKIGRFERPRVRPLGKQKGSWWN